MAYSTSNKFNNAIVGTPMVGADVDIYASHSSPRYQIGTGFERSDGAIFRYAHFGGVMTHPGLLAAQDFSESGTAQIDSLVVAPASATMVPGYNIKPNEIGSIHVQITLGQGNNQYAGGYILIGNGTGVGTTYRIRESNTSIVSGSVILTLYDKLKAALDATSDIAIYGCKYANLESQPATAATDITPVGVNMVAHLTAGLYGWVQTKGVVGILRDASTLAVGDVVRVSEEDKGAVSKMNMTIHMTDSALCAHSTVLDYPILGYCIDGAADTEYALINLVGL